MRNDADSEHQRNQEMSSEHVEHFFCLGSNFQYNSIWSSKEYVQ
jgi:hypothetical protein